MREGEERRDSNWLNRETFPTPLTYAASKKKIFSRSSPLRILTEQPVKESNTCVTHTQGTMNEQTPTRRRPHEPSNNELLASIVSDDQRRSNVNHEEDSSKSRRSLHWEIGPFVLSGVAFDRLQARFVNVTRKLTLDTLRPLPLFLGVSGPSFCFAPDGEPTLKGIGSHSFVLTITRLYCSLHAADIPETNGQIINS